MNLKISRRDSLQFLPDMVTLMNLFTGFLSLIFVTRNEIVIAAWLIVLSLVWDSLDGNIARIFKHPTQLGRELDSLADIVSFIVAPAFLVSKFLLMHVSPWMLLLLFIYLGSGAYRLARFNIQPPITDYFQGLPTPAAAVTVTMVMLACVKNGWVERPLFDFIAVSLLLTISFLMVSKIQYPKLSAIRFSKWQSLFYLGIILFFVLFWLRNEETALAAVCILFLLVSPIYCLKEKFEADQNIKASHS